MKKKLTGMALIIFLKTLMLAILGAQIVLSAAEVYQDTGALEMLDRPGLYEVGVEMSSCLMVSSEIGSTRSLLRSRYAL